MYTLIPYDFIFQSFNKAEIKNKVKNRKKECFYGRIGGGAFVAKLCLTLLTPWTAAHQAPPSMGFSRQEYWSGLPFPSPQDLHKLGHKPGSPALQADSLPSEL